MRGHRHLDAARLAAAAMIRRRPSSPFRGGASARAGATTLLLGGLLTACATPSGSANTQPSADPARPAGGPAGVIGRGTGAEIRLTENGSLVESEVPIGADEAWRALPEAYASLGLGGGVLDAVGRTWGNPRVEERRVAGSRTSSFFRCATSGAGPSSVGRLRIRFAISTTVAAAEGGDAVLSTSVVATGAPWEGTSTDPVGCTSLGRLEEALADAVLGAGGPEVGR